MANVITVNRQGYASEMPADTFWNAWFNAAGDYTDVAMLSPVAFGGSVSYVYKGAEIIKTVITEKESA